jgi:hypothetical protein
VDVAGARRLSWRIEQQRHWRQAAAVADGRQPATDPDTDTLESFEGSERVYAARLTNHGTVRLHKRLVDGVWENELVEESEPLADHPIAHVA